MFIRLILFLNREEAAVEYELSDAANINIMDSADRFYISFYITFPMLTTAPIFDRKRNTERCDYGTNNKWSSDQSMTDLS